MAATKDGRPTSSPARTHPNRRDLVKQASATAALIAALKAAFAAGVHAQAATAPEVSKAILGYIARIDASALMIAKEKRPIAKHGDGGIDPHRNISTIVVPPPQMVANMQVVNIDAFCVSMSMRPFCSPTASSC